MYKRYIVELIRDIRLRWERKEWNVKQLDETPIMIYDQVQDVIRRIVMSFIHNCIWEEIELLQEYGQSN